MGLNWQNDHGKSSILKALDIVLNGLDEEDFESGALDPDLADRLLPVFPVNAKARRITLYCEDSGKQRQLYITVRADLTFVIHEEIVRNPKTTPSSIALLKQIRAENKFILVPALRDATSGEFQELFSRILHSHGISKMIPKKAGGTPKGYRALKDIREQVTNTIKPYIDDALLPEITKHFGFITQHKLALKFDVDVKDVGDWILNNLRLGFQVTDHRDATIALSEAGSGVQSGALLALQRLEQKAAENPTVLYILAVEEPEAFLHPQKQKELYDNIRAAHANNLHFIVTTHSPYIVGETPFSKLGLVRKKDEFSTFHVPDIRSPREGEMFDAYGNDVNSILFFADKVVLVEGESDERVLRLLLQKKYGASCRHISVVSAAGNRNFSPYLRMIRAWGTARIPHLVVTDFDSLTAGADRAIIRGARDAGYALVGEAAFLTRVDAALDKSAVEFENVASSATAFFNDAGLSVFVFTSDLEYSLINDVNKGDAAKILSEESGNKVDYSVGYTLDDLRRQIGSKLAPFNPVGDPKFKKPFIHRKIADTVALGTAHSDIARLLAAIDAL